MTERIVAIGRNEFKTDSGYLLEDGWRKIGEDGGTYVTATLFNTRTGETVSICVRDYEDSRKDDDYWYHTSIDNDARREWCRRNGRITDGLVAKVVKGRKVPIGYTGKVDRVKKVYDRYDRWVANYVVFEDGTATNIDNCVLVD